MGTPASRWIDARISDALATAFDQITGYVRDEYCSPDDVFEALALGWGEGVAEGWREWCEEADDDRA